MASCIRFVFLVIPLALSLLACLLSILACVGSTSLQLFIQDVNFIRLDLSNVDPGALFPSVVTLTREALGIKKVYTLGMWGYCSGDDGLTYCSPPKAAFQVDLKAILTADLAVALKPIADTITLPSEITSKQSMFNALSKAVFITCIIGLVLSLVTALFIFLSMCCGGMCLSGLSASVAFISLAISAGGATGLYLVVKKAFNDSDLGVVATLGTPFYALIWCSVVCSLLCWIGVLVGLCCGGRRYQEIREVRYTQEAQPMMAYHPREMR